MSERYDSIGKTYDSTRRPDPKIFGTLLSLLGGSHGQRILEVGCGSGNYTVAFHEQGLHIEGLDISEEMLSKARKKGPAITWHRADACAMPFDSASFDGVVSVLATHHMHDLDGAIREMGRVTKKGGPLAFFTSTPELMRSFWMTEYLPGVVEVTAQAMTPFDQLKSKLEAAGFAKVTSQPFFCDNSLTDYFLQCGKYRPELYLDPVVRAGISSFALYKDEVKLREGLKRIEDEIRSGKIQEVIQRHESTNGDFIYVRAEKA